MRHAKDTKAPGKPGQSSSNVDDDPNDPHPVTEKTVKHTKAPGKTGLAANDFDHPDDPKVSEQTVKHPKDKPQ